MKRAMYETIKYYVDAFLKNAWPSLRKKKISYIFYDALRVLFFMVWYGNWIFIYFRMKLLIIES